MTERSPLLKVSISLCEEGLPRRGEDDSFMESASSAQRDECGNS